MQLDYIKKLSKAYVIDNVLYEGTNIITEDELTESFYNAIKILKLDHPSLYESVLTSTIYDQQKIFRTYFDIHLDNYNEIITSEFDESELENISEDAGVSAVLLAVVAAVWESLKYIGLSIFGVKGLILFLVMFFWPAANRRISKITTKSVINIFKFFTFLGKKAKEHGDSATLAYSIIHNNANKCLLKCDYEPKKATSSDYLYQMPQGSIFRDIGRIVMSISKEEKLDCIRECYLEVITESVKLAANMYFQCLQNTGDLTRLPLERDFSMYQKLIVKTNINRACDSFMSAFKEALDSYDMSVNLIFAEKESERRSHKLKLMEEIYNLQKNQPQKKQETNSNSNSNWAPKQPQRNQDSNSRWASKQSRQQSPRNQENWKR